MNNRAAIARIPFHPLLLALYPALALFAFNIHEVSLGALWRPLLISLAATLLLAGLLCLVVRNTAKAAVLTSLVLLVFFTYGRIYDALRASALDATGLVRHRYLVLLAGLLLAVALFLVLRSKRDFSSTNRFLNVLSILLVLLPVAQAGAYAIRTASSGKAAASGQAQSGLIAPQQKPDVYYIILDGYTRADALQQELGFDNSSFITQLEQMGFFVADCSRANYNKTQASMMSALNMEYLPDVYRDAATLGIPESEAWLLIKSSAVRHNFESLGYTSVAFDTGYQWTSVTDADLYLSRGRYGFGVQSISPFEQMLLDSTLLSVFSDYQRQQSWQAYGDSHPYANYIGIQEFILDQLPRVADLKEPTFTYAHIDVTHMPFVFSPHGYLTNEGDMQFPQGYLSAIEYINPRMIAILKQILATSQVPPLIVLQADHGFYREQESGSANLSPILNAYYLPGAGVEQLYPSITPVNTFRVIFDAYYEGDYPLLPDRSYDYRDIDHLIPEEYGDCLP